MRHGLFSARSRHRTGSISSILRTIPASGPRLPTYDIVQLLAVYQHVDRARGDLAARRMLATLAERCSETFIVASQPSYIPAIIEVLSAAQFRLERETTSPA